MKAYLVPAQTGRKTKFFVATNGAGRGFMGGPKFLDGKGKWQAHPIQGKILGSRVAAKRFAARHKIQVAEKAEQ